MWNKSGIFNDPSSNQEDLLFIEQILKGDRFGFDKLVRKYQDVIVNMCYRFVGNYQEGEDVAQEVFVKIFRNLSRFRGDARFSTWLFRIAINECRSHERSWWKRIFRNSAPVEGNAGHDDGEVNNQISDGAPSPEEELENKKASLRVRKALKGLPVSQRELVVLCDLEEKSYKEIASIFGIALGTVKSRIARAREALKKELQGIA